MILTKHKIPNLFSHLFFILYIASVFLWGVYTTCGLSAPKIGMHKNFKKCFRWRVSGLSILKRRQKIYCHNFYLRPGLLYKECHDLSTGKWMRKLSCGWLCMCPQIWLVPGNLWLCLPVVGERLHQAHSLGLYCHRKDCPVELCLHLNSKLFPWHFVSLKNCWEISFVVVVIYWAQMSS